MNTPLNVRKLETEIAAKVADIGSRNEEEIRVVQSGLEVFHGVQRERDAQAARASNLATKLAVAGTEIELLRKPAGALQAQGRTLRSERTSP